MGWAFAVGAALSAVGTGAQVAANRRARAAQERQVSQEVERQREKQKRGSALFEQSLVQSTPEVAQRQTAEGEQQRLSAYERLRGIPMSSQDISPSSSSTVVSDTQRGQEIKQGEQARARFYAPSEWELRQQIKNLRTNQALGLLSQEASGSQAILPYELQDAARSQDTLAGIGSLMQTAGALTGLYGMLQAPAVVPGSPYTVGSAARVANPNIAGLTGRYSWPLSVANTTPKPWSFGF